MRSVPAAPENPVAAPPQRSGGGVPLLDRARDLRDRLVADPAFRRWAARFPLTRPVARRRARALFDLCAGFVYSQVLAACVRLRLFDLLHREGPLTAAAVAARTGLPPEGAARLLGAAASLRLLARRSGGRYGLGPLGAAMVGNDGLAAMVEHHALLYADLSDPVALLRGEGRGRTGLAAYWPYAAGGAAAGAGAAEVAEYSALMAATQPLVADEVLGAYDLRRHRCLMDVGGGEGAFLRAAAAVAPDLRLMLFDLPAVAERARARLSSAGLAGRATVAGGDFAADSLPEGADVVSLIRVLHDHDDSGALGILRAVRRALPPGGTLLLAEPLSGTPGAEPVGEAYFGFYLLAMGRGRPRTPDEIGALLGAAGFSGVRRRPTRTPLLTSVMTAHPA